MIVAMGGQDGHEIPERKRIHKGSLLNLFGF